MLDTVLHPCYSAAHHLFITDFLLQPASPPSLPTPPPPLPPSDLPCTGLLLDVRPCGACGASGSDLTYCVGETAESGHSTGSVKGYSEQTPYKVWDILNGLGTMAFAYSFSFVLVEIQVGSYAGPLHVVLFAGPLHVTSPATAVLCMPCDCMWEHSMHFKATKLMQPVWLLLQCLFSHCAEPSHD